MSTITTPSIVHKLLTNNGHFKNDPQADKIYSYLSSYDKKLMWGVYYEGQYGPYGDYIYDIKLLWTAQDGLTEEGTEALANWEGAKS